MTKRSDSTSQAPGREKTCSTGRSRETYRSTTNVPVVEGSVLDTPGLHPFRRPEVDLTRPRRDVQIHALLEDR
jgi:hypothetical protein